ncbi:MAG: histidine--tRNA ligase [Sphaerochaetaceae bacterium]|nr:histidine--tRNA ligase [Sphaerochaetaceae bacterium]
MIEPKVLKGFRDSLPSQEIVRQNLISKIQDIFRSFGFVPIDTPCIEYSEVLLGKGGGETDKQMFRFNDNGNRDVSLRFDLTVPLARFVSANYNSLRFPFKRYHIAKVWRGEKPQKGRYREFLQCDFDIIGADNAQSDFEILLLIHTCLKTMNIGDFRVLVSHRGLLNRYLEKNGIPSSVDEVLRAIDKLGKIGLDGVCAILSETGMSEKDIESVKSFIALPKEDFSQTLDLLSDMLGADCDEIVRLREILTLMKSCGIEKDFVLDTSITRGLDYYTGIVYETILLKMPQIGSICSGGRYNNLTGLYHRDSLPGVGSCIGLDRLLAALEETDSPIVRDSSYADVLLLKSSDVDISLASLLRKEGLKVDCYCGDKGAGAQYAYAEANHIPYAVSSCRDGKLTVKEIATRKVFDGLTIKELVEKLS